MLANTTPSPTPDSSIELNDHKSPTSIGTSDPDSEYETVVIPLVNQTELKLQVPTVVTEEYNRELEARAIGGLIGDPKADPLNDEEIEQEIEQYMATPEEQQLAELNRMATPPPITSPQGGACSNEKLWSAICATSALPVLKPGEYPRSASQEYVGFAASPGQTKG